MATNMSSTNTKEAMALINKDLVDYKCLSRKASITSHKAMLHAEQLVKKVERINRREERLKQRTIELFSRIDALAKGKR
ncbi:hypothetical protein [Spirosoma oryzicola]|uniref:hypothetical protein n=1 Tax=Spirosoma oryzicola TaxID=2898794 RepID=UPI001E54E562|nr:hypothetical protein [Spirosoma oryzicola]UHG93254.1 hypothetical protein LQ777_10215 [Spirosoma oryzicola]